MTIPVDLPSVALAVALSQERQALRCVLDSCRRIGASGFPLLRGNAGKRPVFLLQGGVGRGRIREALLELSRRFPLRAAWSIGFAGGLCETLSPGSLVIPSAVLDGGAVLPASGEVERLRAAITAAGLGVSDGMLLSVDDPLRTPESKRAAHRRFGAVAVDMEAAGVAEAARRLGIPWLAIKAIVDPVDEALPDFLLACTSGAGDVAWPRLLRSLTSGRRLMPLLRLARDSRLAALALRQGLKASIAGGCLDVGSSPPVGLSP